jgi:hypothetical protein
LVKNVLPAHGHPQQLPVEQLEEQLLLVKQLLLQLVVAHVVLQLEEQEAAATWLMGATAPMRSNAINKFFLNI